MRNLESVSFWKYIISHETDDISFYIYYVYKTALSFIREYPK